MRLGEPSRPQLHDITKNTLLALFTTKTHPKPRIMTTHTEDGRSGLLIDRNAGKGEEDGRSKDFLPDFDFVKWIRRNS